MATAKGEGKGKHRIPWQELGEILSKAEVLLPDEEIDQITLTKPRCLLLYTSRVEKPKGKGEW